MPWLNLSEVREWFSYYNGDSANTILFTYTGLGQTIWSSTGGGMSINYPLSMGFKQINNLAAGTASTDAVNVGQIPTALDS